MRKHAYIYSLKKNEAKLISNLIVFIPENFFISEKTAKQQMFYNSTCHFLS